MADIIDDAAAYNELYQRVAFVNQQAKNKPEFDPSFNGKDCVECAEPIAKERIQMHKVRCTTCQADKERREKLFAKPE